MTNDSFKILTEMEVVISTLFPNVDMVKLLPRLEEVTGNYNIQKKAVDGLVDDLLDNIEMFISARRLEGLSERTLSGYRIELGLFYRYINKPTVQITTGDIRKYLAIKPELMRSTVGRKLSVLKSFFGWLVQEEILLRNPTLKIKTPKTPKRLPKGLTVEELELVRESCKTLRERALVEVLYSTGLRLSEASNMKIEDVNFRSMSAKVIGKGDVEGTVYLSFKALHHLRKYLKSRNDDCPYLFITYRKPYRKVSGRSIADEIDNIADRSKLNKNLTPHVFRHTLAMLMFDNNADLADVQRILRHEQPSTTLIYGQVSEARAKEAHRRFHVM